MRRLSFFGLLCFVGLLWIVIKKFNFLILSDVVLFFKLLNCVLFN
jgi:hypothetical protein